MPNQYNSPPLPQRFWQYVEKSDGCWIWRGTQNGRGYGFFYIARKQRLVHRYAYELLIGPIRDGAVVMHTCDVPLCVRPEHLKAATQRENMLDMKSKGRQLFGTRNHHAGLTDDDVRTIRADYAAGRANMPQLARRYGQSAANMHRVIHRMVWTHVA